MTEACARRVFPRRLPVSATPKRLLHDAPATVAVDRRGRSRYRHRAIPLWGEGLLGGLGARSRKAALGAFFTYSVGRGSLDETATARFPHEHARRHAAVAETPARRPKFVDQGEYREHVLWSSRRAWLLRSRAFVPCGRRIRRSPRSLRLRSPRSFRPRARRLRPPPSPVAPSGGSPPSGAPLSGSPSSSPEPAAGACSRNRGSARVAPRDPPLLPEP